MILSDEMAFLLPWGFYDFSSILICLVLLLMIYYHSILFVVCGWERILIPERTYKIFRGFDHHVVWGLHTLCSIPLLRQRPERRRSQVLAASWRAALLETTAGWSRRVIPFMCLRLRLTQLHLKSCLALLSSSAHQGWSFVLLYADQGFGMNFRAGNDSHCLFYLRASKLGMWICVNFVRVAEASMQLWGSFQGIGTALQGRVGCVFLLERRGCPLVPEKSRFWVRLQECLQSHCAWCRQGDSATRRGHCSWHTRSVFQATSCRTSGSWMCTVLELRTLHPSLTLWVLDVTRRNSKSLRIPIQVQGCKTILGQGVLR